MFYGFRIAQIDVDSIYSFGVESNVDEKYFLNARKDKKMLDFLVYYLFM